MKKLLVFCAAMLCSFLAFSQEAEVSVVPRLEANKYGSEWSLGASSLYTFIDGSFGDRFSYSVSNHWLSSDVKSLYQNTLKPGESNWVDWAYLSVDLDKFSVYGGKLAVASGGTEFIDNDVDVFDALASMSWNNSSVYFWGFGVDYNPWDNTTFSLQYTQGSGAFAWTGEYGPYSPYWGFRLNNDKIFEEKCFINLGNKLTFDRWNCTLDAFYTDLDFLEFHSEWTWNALDCLDLTAVADWTNLDYYYGGIKALVFPLKDDLMRVHAVASLDNEKTFFLQFGVSFNLSFNL